MVRKFIKATSVFGAWKEDNKASISASFKIDWENTRITKVIRDATDLARTHDYLESIYDFLKV